MLMMQRELSRDVTHFCKGGQLKDLIQFLLCSYTCKEFYTNGYEIGYGKSMLAKYSAIFINSECTPAIIQRNKHKVY